MLIGRERRRFFVFLLVGGLNTAVGYALFVAFLWTGLSPTIALAMATLGGILFNFQSVGRIVFSERGAGRAIPFLAVYAMQFVIDAIGLHMLTVAGVSPLLAQALLVPPLAVSGFLAMRRYVFDRRQIAPDDVKVEHASGA